MGMNDRIEPKQRGKSRGSTNNVNRLAGLTGGQGKKGNADWGTADPRWIAAVVVAITSVGGACSFTLSRDGGAHGLRLFLDGGDTSLWFNGDASLDEELEKVFAYLETLQ